MSISRSWVSVVAGLAALAGTVALPGAASSAGLGQTCGGFIGRACDQGLYCDLHPGSCRGADIQGRCVRVPHVCHLMYRPVCGCDGRTYGNDCQRIANRVAKHHDGRCR